jgi:hypothetical protein
MNIFSTLKSKMQIKVKSIFNNKENILLLFMLRHFGIFLRNTCRHCLAWRHTGGGVIMLARIAFLTIRNVGCHGVQCRLKNEPCLVGGPLKLPRSPEKYSLVRLFIS